MLTLVLLVAVGTVPFESVLLVVVVAITSGSVVLIAVGGAAVSALFEVAGAAVVQADKAITLIAITILTILKIVFRFICFLH